MPILPLDDPEPFAALLGVMLYPGLDETERAKARAFAAHWLAEPIRRATEDGHKLSYETLQYVATNGGLELTDVEDRFDRGILTGELLKALYILADTEPALASWANATKILHGVTKKSRASLYNYRQEFRRVVHLWAAWTIRAGKFCPQPDIGYDGHEDFQAFLAESEILRAFGQEWRAARGKSEPPLPHDVWRVPDDWRPLPRRDNWPRTGVIPRMSLSPELVAGLKPAGRPPHQS